MPENPVIPETLSGEKVLLKKIEVSDVNVLHQVFSNPEAMQYWITEKAKTTEDTLAWIKQSQSLTTAYHSAWSVIDKKSRNLVGIISYHDREPWQDRVQISYTFLPDYFTDPIVTDAITCVVNLCFSMLKSHRIESLVDLRDRKSKDVLKKLGFYLEGILRGRFRFRDTYRDVASYSLLAKQWKVPARDNNRTRDSSTLHWQLPTSERPNQSLDTIQPGVSPKNFSDKIPLGLAFPVYLVGDQLKGNHAGYVVKVEAPHKVLKAIIEVADGLHTFEEILAHVPASFERNDIVALLTSMKFKGLLIASDQRLEHQWIWAQNPPPYYTEIPADLPARLTQAASDKVSAPIKKRTAPRPADDVLVKLLQKRKSTSDFSNIPLTDSEISKLLYCSYGVLDKKKEWKGKSLSRRTVPSAGAIYPLVLIWAQWQKTSKLDAGVYKVNFGAYRTLGFELISTDCHKVLRAIVNPVPIAEAHGILFISVDFSLPRSKYGNRAVPLSLIEAGHVAQNIQLAAALLGKGVLEIGGFTEKRVKELAQTLSCEPLIGLVIGNARPKKNVSENNDVIDIEFDWIDKTGPYQMPFHLARTRLNLKEYESDWCWGRSSDPLIAIKKSVGEAIERHACQSPKDVKWARPRDLKDYVDPSRLVSYPSSSHKRKGFPLAPFSENKLYPWVRAQRVDNGKSVPVLVDHVYFLDNFKKSYDFPYTWTSSSGVASYPTIGGAIERALLELIERHMFMLTWLGHIVPPRVIPSSLPSDIQERLKNLETYGWNTQILLLGKGPVTTFLILAQNVKRGMTRVSAASGFDREDALRHALEEAESSIPSVSEQEKSASRTISPQNVYSAQDHGDLYLQRKYFRKADWLLKGSSKISFDKIVSPCHSVGEIFHLLIKRRLTSYIVDMTPTAKFLPRIASDIKVVRVLVEGLLPISFGFGMEPVLTELTFGAEIAKKTAGKYFPHPFN